MYKFTTEKPPYRRILLTERLLLWIENWITNENGTLQISQFTASRHILRNIDEFGFQKIEI